MRLRQILSGAFFFLRQWILLPVTLGLLEASAAQRVANTSLNMPPDLPDGSFEVVDAFPGLRFSNSVAVVSLPGNDSLLFVVEKPGRIRKVHLGTDPQWAMDHWRMSFKRGSEGSTLQFPNPGSGELSWNLEFDSKATSNASGTLMANSSEKKDEKGLLSVPVDFSKDAAGFFKMRIDWPEAPNADVEP